MWRPGSSRWRWSCGVGGIGWRGIGKGSARGARSCAGAGRGGRGHGRGRPFCPRSLLRLWVAGTCGMCGVSVAWVGSGAVEGTRTEGQPLVRLDWRSDQHTHATLARALISHRTLRSVAPRKTVPFSIDGARLSRGQRHPRGSSHARQIQPRT